MRGNELAARQMAGARGTVDNGNAPARCFVDGETGTTLRCKQRGWILHLKLRLERMDRRVNLQKLRSENNENSIVSEHVLGACSPPAGNSAGQAASTSELQRVHPKNSSPQYNESFKIRLNTSGGITTVKQELNDQGKHEIKQESAGGGDGGSDSAGADASAAAGGDGGIGNGSGSGSNTNTSTSSSGAGGCGVGNNITGIGAGVGDSVGGSNSSVSSCGVGTGACAGAGGIGGGGASGNGESRFEWEERKKRRSDPPLLVGSGGIGCGGIGGGKRKRGVSCSSTVSNDTSSTVGHDKTSNHEVGRKAERKGKSLVKKESFLTTEEHYYTAVGDPAYTLNLKESSPVETNGAQLEVPNWRVKIYTSCYTMEGTENLDDEIFNKRHLKLENDERRRKRWDVQRIREQRHIEKLKQRQERQNHQATCYNTNHTGPCPSTTEEEAVTSLWPDIEHIQSLQVDSQLPVTAFGAPIPSFTPSEFSLPWSSTVRSKSRRPKRSTARRKSSRR